MLDKAPHAVTYEKCLADVKEAFRVIEQNFSTGIRASLYQEVEHLLNQAKTDLENQNPAKAGLE